MKTIKNWNADANETYGWNHMNWIERLGTLIGYKTSNCFKKCCVVEGRR